MLLILLEGSNADVSVKLQITTPIHTHTQAVYTCPGRSYESVKRIKTLKLCIFFYAILRRSFPALMSRHYLTTKAVLVIGLHIMIVANIHHDRLISPNKSPSLLLDPLSTASMMSAVPSAWTWYLSQGHIAPWRRARSCGVTWHLHLATKPLTRHGSGTF